MNSLVVLLSLLSASSTAEIPPTRPAAKSGYEPSPSLLGRPAILTTDFDANSALSPSGGSGAIAPYGGEGAAGFRFICGAGQLSYDDPIVYPGKPGASHLHQFYGNLSVDANTTYESLRSKGDSTCNSTGKGDGSGKASQRSAYWMPALLDGAGYVVQPNFVIGYYKRAPLGSASCGDPSDVANRRHGICVGIPTGLKMVVGSDFKGGYTQGMRTDEGRQISFSCGTSNPGRAYLVEALDDCAVGATLYIAVVFPDCWDGKNLDTPDHRSHVAYGSYGSWGYLRCPVSHPYNMTNLTVKPEYTVTAALKASGRLSSDEMNPSRPAGWSIHFDYWEGWHQPHRLMFEANCIQKQLNCSGGDLGNGLQLRGAAQPYYMGKPGWVHPNPLVAVPKATASHQGH